MEIQDIGKKLLGQMLVIMMILTSCMPADIPSTGIRNDNVVTGGTGTGNGNNATETTGGVGSGKTTTPPKVEIRHLIEPNLSTDLSYNPGTGHAGGGSYVRKLTLPKNFSGRLYIAGINIGTLVDKHVRVRFKFGVGREPVTVSGTVTQAPGITPSTSINVIVLDLRSEPFRNIRLPYDLYDYNEYDFAAGDTPVQDNRDTGLYCRGLKLEDDPTFTGVGACDGAESISGQPDEECLYAYAKVLDQGLVQVSNSVLVPLIPSLPQVKTVTGGTSYYHDDMYSQLKKPLADTMPISGTNVAGSYLFSLLASPANSTNSINVNFANSGSSSIWDARMINGTQYFYRGPYRLINSQDWQIQFPQLDGKNRLFREGSWVNYPLSASSPLPDDNGSAAVVGKDFYNRLYYNSYLFPLATKININSNVIHLSSSNVLGSRFESTVATAGSSLWMDGSNARAQSRNLDLEHVGSCNVSSTIEIIAKDTNGNDYTIATANDVKLQLVRPTQFRTDTGNEVLYQNFKTCSSNASCGGSECCFNNRCWDSSLVSQCFDSSSTQGNRNIGESCSTDLECTSLCCNRTSGLCAPHNTLLATPVLCSKPSGDYCIAKEWCQKSPVTTCLVVKTGTDALGNTTCRQQCYTTQEFGDCKAGICTPPVQPPIPAFNPNDPNACANAVPAPSF